MYNGKMLIKEPFQLFVQLTEQTALEHGQDLHQRPKPDETILAHAQLQACLKPVIGVHPTDNHGSLTGSAPPC